jgi:predicted nucleotidyltransferase
MRQVKALDRILSQKSKVKILRFLVLNPGEYSGRSLARGAGVNHQQCNKALKELYAENVLKTREMGGAHLYSLDGEKYVVQKIITPMFRSEADTDRELVMALKGLKGVKVTSLILFGSMARGQGTAKSDMDVAVVLKTGRDKAAAEGLIFEKRKAIFSQFGAAVEPYLATEKEFRDRFLANDDLINNIVKDGILIYGKYPGEMIAGL